MEIDIQNIGRLLALLGENGIAEFSLEQEGARLHVRRDPGGSLPQPQQGSAPPESAASVPAPSLRPSKADDAPDVALPTLKSPIVGTFYRAPDPNSPAFVNVGDHVRVGQVLCIVEAMKLMNEIEAEQAGTVVKIHPENGQPVQYGDPLFTVKPD